METPERLSQDPLTLLASALGPPSVWSGKLRRLVEILAAYRRGDVVDKRLSALHRQGVIERIPTQLQLIVGAIDMLRFWISPAAADYYAQQGISYGFHQLLRFLDEPASLGDPVGLLSTRDGIIGHLMQVVHANPVYDLQLLQMFEDGLDELERQLSAMLIGKHPRSRSILAIVEEADYHQRLLDFVREYRRDKEAAPLLRKNVASQPEFMRLESVFGSMTGAFRYFAVLPSTPLAALRHVLTVRTFPWHLVNS